MRFELDFSEDADQTLDNLENFNYKKYKKIANALNKMQTNLRHPSLQTHKYNDLSGPNGEEVFECYAENKTPGAWRIFWYYGPGKGVLTIVAITPHP